MLNFNIMEEGMKVFYLMSLLLWGCQVQGRLLSLPTKPDPDDAAASARWLVSHNFWGVLNTVSTDLGGAPFGNVVSFSDGLPNEGGGSPYFYLTTLDPTARNAMKDEKASFTVSEYPLGTCGRRDPQNPSCSKMSLTGKAPKLDPNPTVSIIVELLLVDEWHQNGHLKLVDEKSKEAEFGRNALFSKHPEMRGWPEDHNFQVFKLEIENIFLINWFGGPKPLTVEQYLHPKLNNVGFIL